MFNGIEAVRGAADEPSTPMNEFYSARPIFISGNSSNETATTIFRVFGTAT